MLSSHLNKYSRRDEDRNVDQFFEWISIALSV